MTTEPVYILIRPDGTAQWGQTISSAEKELGPHGIGRAFLTDGSRLRIAMSDCALILREEYAPNPYAAQVLAGVAGMPADTAPETRGPVILFGSTFTERLSAAPHLHAQIAADIAAGDHYWLLTLHPKCPPELFERYRALAGANARFIEPEQVMAAQRAADVLVSDTSSIVSEFIVQHKPVVTFRNRVPKPHMIDFDDPAQLQAMLQRALHPDEALQAEIVRYADAIHPYRDGLSSERVIAATEDFLAGEMGTLRRKPFGSWVRDLQIRKDLGYWGPSQR